MSTEKITLEDALEMFAEIFEVDVDELTVDTCKDDIEGWDSMGVLSLMAEYDARFQIIFDPEQLETFESIGDLVDVLKKADKLAD